MVDELLYAFFLPDQDSDIRGIAAKESKLLDRIGAAHMEQEIQKKVLKDANEQEKTVEAETRVGPLELER